MHCSSLRHWSGQENPLLTLPCGWLTLSWLHAAQPQKLLRRSRCTSVAMSPLMRSRSSGVVHPLTFLGTDCAVSGAEISAFRGNAMVEAANSSFEFRSHLHFPDRDVARQ